MGIFDFVRKQFVDVIQWAEDSNGVLSWRYPMLDMEIQNGATLIVRDSQIAVFVNEGTVADIFGPGTHKISTQNIPILTNLKNWDKFFESPFKSDVIFFSTRLQLDQKWGTQQPITIRDKDFGMVRLRTFGNFNYRLHDPKKFYTEIAGTRETYTTEDLDGQLRGLVLQNISNAIASSGIPFLDLASNQITFAQVLTSQLQAQFETLGLKLEGMTVQNVSLPEELQKILDQKIGMGMIGNNMGQFMQYQTGQAIPEMAKGVGNGSGVGGEAVGMGAGLAMGQILAQNMQSAFNNSNQTAAPQGNVAAPAPAPAPAPASISPDEIMATLEKLGDLKAKGILTQEEFDVKKAELLKKLT